MKMSTNEYGTCQLIVRNPSTESDVKNCNTVSYGRYKIKRILKIKKSLKEALKTFD